MNPPTCIELPDSANFYQLGEHRKRTDYFRPSSQKWSIFKTRSSFYVNPSSIHKKSINTAITI